MGAAAPYILAAAGAGVSAVNTRNTLKRQDRAAAAGIRQQARRQKDIDARVDAELVNLGKSEAETERAASADDFLAQLQRTRAAAAAGNPELVGASARYAGDVNAQNQSATAEAARVADLMSRISAPILQRQREAQGMAQLGTDIGIIGRAAAGDDFLTQLRIRSIRNNPWLDAAGQVMSGVGSGMASRAPSSNKYSTGYVPETVTLDNGTLMQVQRPYFYQWDGR